jgi:hypothetical protein
MSLQLPTILSPPTPCTPVPALTVSPQVRSRSCRSPFPGRLPFWASPLPSQARQCIRPYRVHHFLNYGLVVRFRLLPTPPLDDAVAFSYGQPVLCPTGTFTPLLVRTFRRTRDGLCAVPFFPLLGCPKWLVGRHGDRPSHEKRNRRKCSRLRIASTDPKFLAQATESQVFVSALQELVVETTERQRVPD